MISMSSNKDNQNKKMV